MVCKCGCGFDVVRPELITLLQECVDHFGDRIIITSGCRCAAHNKMNAGSINSQHLFGAAADFKIFKGGEQVDPDAIADWLEAKPGLGVGRYHNRCHVDVRGTDARWRG